MLQDIRRGNLPFRFMTFSADSTGVVENWTPTWSGFVKINFYFSKLIWCLSIVKWKAKIISQVDFCCGGKDMFPIFSVLKELLTKSNKVTMVFISQALSLLIPSPKRFCTSQVHFLPLHFRFVCKNKLNVISVICYKTRSWQNTLKLAKVI